MFALKKNVRKNKAHEVRVNSGRLRGRKLAFPAAEGLRPTLGRTRETLFNWLRPNLVDARCLDLFAGSGVLGIEAASIGAREVVLVENQPQTAKYLAASIDSLGLQDICTLHTTGASAYLAQCSQPFDIVFLDPPFAATALLEQAIALVCQRGLVRQHIYLEFDQQQESAVAALLSTFELSPSKTTKAGSTRSWLISAC